MKTVCKKLLSLMLVALLLISAVPFQAMAANKINVQIYINEVYALDPDAGLIRNKEYELGTKLSETFHAENFCNNRYSKYISDGKVFQGYVFEDGTRAWGSKKLAADMANSNGDVVLTAVFDFPTKSIKLNANGGTCDKTSVKVKRADVYPELPTPKRPGYTFLGWYTAVDDELVGWGTKVNNYQNLVAKWEVGTYNVTFQNWDPAKEEFYDSSVAFNVTPGETLNEHADRTGHTLPTTDQFCNRSGYEIDGWVLANGNAFTFDKAVKADLKVRPNYVAKTYTITFDPNGCSACEKTCDVLSKREAEYKYGTKLQNLWKPEWKNHVFIGWFDADGNEYKNGDKFTIGDVTLYARWAPKATVEMRVYRDDADGFKSYYASAAILNNELNLDNLDIEDYLSGDYDFDGWFDYDGWIDYKGGDKDAPEITRLPYVDTHTNASNHDNTSSTITVIYGMVKGYKAPNTGNTGGSGNNYNNNDSNADPSNPKTGDMITSVFTVMMVSAGALALVYFDMKKRQMAE